MAKDAFMKKVAHCGHCGANWLFKLRGKTCGTCKFGILEVARVPKSLKV